MAVQKRESIDAVRRPSSKWERTVSQSQLTFLIKVPRTAVGVKSARRRLKVRRSTEKCDREAKQEGTQKGPAGVLVLGVAVRKTHSPKAFAAVDDLNAKYIYAFLFH